MPAMLVDRNNKIFLLGELTAIFMQTMLVNFVLFCPPTWRKCKPPIAKNWLQYILPWRLMSHFPPGTPRVISCQKRGSLSNIRVVFTNIPQNLRHSTILKTFDRLAYVAHPVSSRKLGQLTYNSRRVLSLTLGFGWYLRSRWQAIVIGTSVVYIWVSELTFRSFRQFKNICNKSQCLES